MIGPYSMEGPCWIYSLEQEADMSSDRGMEHGVFIDLEPKSIETIRTNLKATRLEAQGEVFRNDAERALKVLAKRGLLADVSF